MGVFLDPVEADSLEFRGPVHDGCNLEWLIDRKGAFQAMEAAVASARKTVHITGWLFLPSTPILDPKVKSLLGSGGEKTWLDLIRFTATKDPPAVVRILPTDFDAFFYTSNHRLCWRTIRDLADLSTRLGSSHEDNLQFFPTLHGSVTGLLSSPLLKLVAPTATLESRIAQTVVEYNKLDFRAAMKLFQETPGHWSSIEPDTSTKTFAVRSTARDIVNVGSHHQKTVIVDGETGFCGGMDFTPLALNDRRHKLQRRHGSRRRMDLLWHDVHCKLTGPAVFDMEQSFFHRWQAERVQFFDRLNSELMPNAPTSGLPVLFFPVLRDAPKPKPAAKGRVKAQVHRTVSIDDPSATFKTLRRDILDSYEKAIAEAESFVYVENQYLRSRDMARALIARRKQKPRLQLVIVIPVAPEEFTKESAADPLVLQPIAIQNEIIDELQAAFGASLGIFSLVAGFKSSKGPPLTKEAGSPQIYVHTKILIVDDKVASIGSANANGRSFFLDSEINIGWQHDSVRQFRLDLWRELLGVEGAELAGWKPDTFVLRWKEIAERNLRLPAGRRSGFAVPHDHEKFKKIAAKLPLPEAFEAFLSIANPAEPGLPPELLDPDREDRAAPDVSQGIS